VHKTYQLSQIDAAVVAAYLVGIVLLGLFVSRKRATEEEYFLASRGAVWPVIGLSLIASNISASTLVGLAGAAYGIGISVYDYEWSAAVIIVFSCAFVMPVVLQSRVFTLPELMERRYAPFVRTYFSALSIFLNIALDSAGALFAGAVLFQFLCPGVPLWVVASGLATLTALYAIAGGLRSLLYTDMAQAVILLVSSLIIAVAAFERAGGWARVVQQIPHSKLSLLRPVWDPALPWPGLLLGVPIVGFYFWCANQCMAQRILSAQSLDHARWGGLLAGLLKLPILFLMVLPGSAALLIFPGLRHPDQVYAKLLFESVPPGLMGLAVAGFLAAMMASLASNYNSAATLISIDFLGRLKTKAGAPDLVLIGRLTTLALMALSIVCVSVIQQSGGTLWQYLQMVLSFAVPPAAALFAAALFWPKANAVGAAVGIPLGVGSGVTLYVATQVMKAFPMHFLYAAPVVFLVTLGGIVLGSLLAPRPIGPAAYVSPLQVWREDTRKLAGRPWFENYRYLSALLLSLTAVIIWCFR
jgi:SSS family solute:Na+ symporter